MSRTRTQGWYWCRCLRCKVRYQDVMPAGTRMCREGGGTYHCSGLCDECFRLVKGAAVADAYVAFRRKAFGEPPL